MLEHVPHWLGQAIAGLRAGADKLAIVQPELGSFTAIELKSPAFTNGGRLPERFTADGDGVSPPLFWTGLPEGTHCVALLVEDPDAPAPVPLVHAVIWGLPANAGRLEEGAIVPDSRRDDDAGGDVGRNSYLREGWLPPDPPTGHGPHNYAFQVFALGPPTDPKLEPGPNPSRSAIVKAMAGRVLAAGLLTGVYSRGEAAPVGPGGGLTAVPSA